MHNSAPASQEGFYPSPIKWQMAVKQAFGFQTNIVSVKFFVSKKNQVSLLRLGGWNEPTDEVLKLENELEDGFIEHVQANLAVLEKARQQQGVENPELLEVTAKYCVWSDAQREYNVLQKAYNLGLAVPAPVCLTGSIIFSAPLKGTFLKGEALAAHAISLGKWLANFHSKMTPAGVKGVFSRGDCSLRNFLLSNDGLIYSYDFEEAFFGAPELDLGDLAANLLLAWSDRQPQAVEQVAEWLRPVQNLLRGYYLPINLEHFVISTSQALNKKSQFHPEKQSNFAALAERFQQASVREMLQAWSSDQGAADTTSRESSAMSSRGGIN